MPCLMTKGRHQAVSAGAPRADTTLLEQTLPGDLALGPCPAWAQTDDAPVSITRLMRAFHEAARQFDPSPFAWNEELADPEGGALVCHNDVCLENVIFRDGVAIGLIDFDFAAPGRPEHDLAQLAKMCVPLEDDRNGARLGWEPADRPDRLRLIAGTYGPDALRRAALFEIVEHDMATSGEFVRRHAEAAEPGFVQLWSEGGGAEFYEHRKAWWRSTAVASSTACTEVSARRS